MYEFYSDFCVFTLAMSSNSFRQNQIKAYNTIYKKISEFSVRSLNIMEQLVYTSFQ